MFIFLLWVVEFSVGEEVRAGSPGGRQDASPTNSKPAKLRVSGYGFPGNLALKKQIRTLVLNGKKPPLFDVSFVEDAALIVQSTPRRDGYLNATVTVELTLEDGRRTAFTWDETAPAPLPHASRIRKARFRIHKGVLYHYQSVEFSGLKSLPQKEALSFFIETGVLLPLKHSRIYTPSNLRDSLANLSGALERLGYENAKASAHHLERDDKTGAVRVEVEVEEGPRSMVRSVREEFFFAGETQPREVRTVYPRKPYSRLWEQDFTQALRTNDYHRGYPDAKVEVKRLKQESEGQTLQLDLEMLVHGSNQVRIGKVEFEGEKHTRESLMRERARLKEGTLLDRIKVEDGRYRLAQLGIFDSVDLNYRNENEHTRDVLYHVKESKATDVSLLFGYGSYELLRGGVELERKNIFGLAQDARVKMVQSFKASSGEFYYTIPELLGRDVDLFANATGLRRQEVSFLREEYGGGLGVHKYVKEFATDASARYNYQILNAAQIDGILATEGPRNPAVGSIITDLKHDRRDNPLYPHRGYKVFLNVESATQYLGGDVNYERLDLSASWHVGLGGGRWLHLGVSHAAAFALGSSSNNLPFTRRFFPGGQNSIRGYQEGRASPRDQQGNFVGAETYALGSVEFEQALTPRWSLVLFSDSLGEATRIQHYPFDTGLHCVGVGLNWRTLVGPVRLEYGHNLNPRHRDPSGTVQFSFGFPF